MNVPTPIENLPGFNSGTNSQPGSNPWLKFIIVGGVLLIGSSSFRIRYEKSTTE